MDIRLHQVAAPLVPDRKPSQTKQTAFADLLKEQQLPKISKHAKLRMQERNIEISDQKWTQIVSKLQEAKNKGVTDSLVVMDQGALLVSVKNNTVITAMNKSEAEGQVFTNINGTIVVK